MNTEILIAVTVIFIWLGFLTVFVLRAIANYNRLTKGITNETLSKILSDFISQSKLTQIELNRVLSEINKVKHEQLNFIQKIGLVRFNPFADTGGDQSFALALLDAKDNGIIITSLYARTGVRWYVKTIKNGKGVEHELSKEEKETLKKTKKFV